MGETNCITAEARRWRSHSIKCAFGTAEIRRGERQKTDFYKRKDKKSKKAIIYNVAVPPLCLSGKRTRFGIGLCVDLITVGISDNLASYARNPTSLLVG
jgi:hypothetical protein